MAIVTKGFELSISVADNGANVSTLSWEANTAVVTDFATAVTARDGLVTDLSAITDSIIIGTRLTEVQYEDSVAYPVAGVENENKASISYLITGTNEVGNLKIPAPVQDIFVSPTGPSANVVDVGDALVTAYTDNFRVTGGWAVSDGQSLQTVLKGKRISAKNNNG
jgi:hypothetical protein